MSFKKLLIASISCVFMLFPRLELDGCGPNLYDEEYRVWIFQPNLVNNDALLPFTYSTNFFFQAGKRDDGESIISYDTSYLKINALEWQAECPSAKPADIYALLYGTTPSVYTKKMANNGFAQNTFMQDLKTKPELLAYFNFAKQCEASFSYEGYNAKKDWNLQKDSLAKKALIPKAEAILKTTKSPFIRLRTAYLLIKDYVYLENTEGVKKTFDTYIKGTNSTSWVLGSAMFYYAKAYPDGAVRNLLAANCYEKTVDKKFQSLRLISTNERAETLAKASNNNQKALVGAMMSLRYPGRSLPEMQAVYAANPTQAELPMLVEREINKLEDWLFSYKLTGQATSISREIRKTKKDDENTEEPWKGMDDYRKKQAAQQKINWASDREYLNNVVAFVNKLIAENKIKDRAFMLLSGAHLAFLKQDFAQARTYLTTLKAEQNVRANIRIQGELTNLLCDLYATPTISPAVEDAIVRFETTLQSNKKDIVDFGTFREQVYIFLGKKFIEQGKIAKGCLLSMMTDRYTGSVGAYTHENGYHRLYSLGKPADFDETLQIITTPKTSFEKFLANEKRPYSFSNDYYDPKTKSWVEVKTPRAWDVNKIKDYKASYFVRNDQIDSALAVFKTIPASVWKKDPYIIYMNCNPFYVELVHPHEPTVADSVKYDKASFLKSFVELRNEAQANPSLNAKNYYLLGNAYFNMTWSGNYWLMSDIYWGQGEQHSDYFGEDKTFINSYFGLERAQKQYELCLKNTKDEKLAALCHFMVGYCAKRKSEYLFYQKNDKWDDNAPKPPVVENPGNAVFKTKFPNRFSAYTSKQYWCTNYESLAKLYCGF
jgi:hypothetical protein